MMRELLTAQEVADLLHCHPQSVYRNKELPFVKIPGIGKRYKESELYKYIEQRTIKPPIQLLNNQSFQLTELPRSPIYTVGGEKGEVAKAKNKTRFNLGYGGYVYLRKYPSGKTSWYIEYRDSYGKRKQEVAKNAQTKEEAFVALRKTQAEAFDRLYNTKKKQERVRLFEFSDMYLENYAKVNKEKSWKTDRNYLNGIKKFFGNIYLDEFGTLKIERYKKERLKLNKAKATVNRGLAVLRTLLNKAVEWKYLEKSQVPEVKLIPLKDNFRVRTLSEEEEERLELAFQESPEYLKPAVLTALYGGLRKGETLGLMTSKNIDFEKREITLGNTQTKSGRVRCIPIHNKLYSELVKLHEKNGKSPYLFLNPKTGKPLTSVSKAFKGACKRAGIEGFRYHDLRHTFASRLVEQGVDLITVKDLLGHSSVKITERYTHSNQAQKRKAIESLGNKVADNKSEKESKKPENREDLLLNCDVEKSQVEKEALSYLFSAGGIDEN